MSSLPGWLQARLRQGAQQYPPYVTETFDLRRWRGVLEEWGIDKRAFALLTELNNCSDRGPELANFVMSLLVKKIQDSHNPRSIKVRNPSALVETTCKNMIDYLE